MSFTKVELIEKYLAVKAQIEDIEQREIAPRKEILKKIEAVMKAKLDAEGEQSTRTDEGTAYISTTDYASVSDEASFFQFVIDNSAWDLLEKRVSKTATRAFIESHKIVPPGVTYGQKREVRIRRSPN